MTPLDFDKHIPWLTTEALMHTRAAINAELASREDRSKLIGTVSGDRVSTVGEGMIG